MLPLAAITGGVILCYAATGVNDFDDLYNPYYLYSAAPSILLSMIPLGTEARLAEMASKPLIETISISVEKFLAKRKQQGVFNYLKEGTEDYLLLGGLNAFVETCGYEKL